MVDIKLSHKYPSLSTKKAVLAKKASEDDADQVVSIQNGSVSFKELRPGLYLVMQIEDELGVSLEMSAEYNTVDKLLAYIESK